MDLTELKQMEPDLKTELVESAITILSKETGLSEEKIIKLCVLNAGMNGLNCFDCGKTAVDGYETIEFLRGMWITRGIWGRKIKK
jgi:hypothetical protein